jgi:thiamine biosynthesis lipoprotein
MTENAVAGGGSRFTFESMGTSWTVTLWDELDPQVLENLRTTIIARATAFDHTYSRFIDDSLVWKIAKGAGTYEVPTDLVAMLRIYRSLYTPSMRKLNPLIGHTISDLGYDKDYSLEEKAVVRETPDFLDTLKIIDDTHIELKAEALIDLGALGKGYFVDRIAEYLREEGIEEYLVDGSGDIVYSKNEGFIIAGLEDPEDQSKIIGTLELKGRGAFCASSGARRRWKGFHHTIDPESGTSPDEVLATWVIAKDASLADALATCLFFVPEGNFRPAHEFEACIMKNGRRIVASPGFRARFFS